MRKATTHGIHVTSGGHNDLLYTSQKRISPEKQRKLLQAVLGKAALRRIAEAEKRHRACEE